MPSASNSSTGGADTQHFERGGFSAAPFSSSVSERGRWITQIWPCASTVMPPTWPRIQLFGSGFGQDASTAKVGMSPACAGGSRALPISMAAVKQAEMVLRKDVGRARVRRRRHGCLPMIFLGGLSRLRGQSIAGRIRSQRFDTVIASASEAIHRPGKRQAWIASSRRSLAMTWRELTPARENSSACGSCSRRICRSRSSPARTSAR